MAFQLRNLSILEYGNGFAMWHYRTEDTLAVVDDPGYFADADEKLSPGDIIAISASDGGTMRFVRSIEGLVVEALKP